MPNHIHVLWEQLKMNGKETPIESFEKYTGHMFLKQLRIDKENLSYYATEQKDSPDSNRDGKAILWQY